MCMRKSLGEAGRIVKRGDAGLRKTRWRARPDGGVETQTGRQLSRTWRAQTDGALSPAPLRAIASGPVRRYFLRAALEEVERLRREREGHRHRLVLSAELNRLEHRRHLGPVRVRPRLHPRQRHEAVDHLPEVVARPRRPSSRTLSVADMPPFTCPDAENQVIGGIWLATCSGRWAPGRSARRTGPPPRRCRGPRPRSSSSARSLACDVRLPMLEVDASA